MMYNTGCVIMRDKRGNPGTMHLIREDIPEEQANAMCKRFIAADKRLRDRARNAGRRTRIEEASRGVSSEHVDGDMLQTQAK